MMGQAGWRIHWIWHLGPNAWFCCFLQTAYSTKVSNCLFSGFRYKTHSKYRYFKKKKDFSLWICVVKSLVNYLVWMRCRPAGGNAWHWMKIWGHMPCRSYRRSRGRAFVRYRERAWMAWFEWRPLVVIRRIHWWSLLCIRMNLMRWLMYILACLITPSTLSMRVAIHSWEAREVRGFASSLGCTVRSTKSKDSFNLLTSKQQNRKNSDSELFWKKMPNWISVNFGCLGEKTSKPATEAT